MTQKGLRASAGGSSRAGSSELRAEARQGWERLPSRGSGECGPLILQILQTQPELSAPARWVTPGVLGDRGWP